MDARRLDTGQVLAAGILNKCIPKTDIPDDRERVAVSVEYPSEEEWIGTGTVSPEKVATAVASGAVVHCAEYYGIPYLWKDGKRYKGRLLQYRVVTESHSFATTEAAVEWFCETAEAVAG